MQIGEFLRHIVPIRAPSHKSQQQDTYGGTDILAHESSTPFCPRRSNVVQGDDFVRELECVAYCPNDLFLKHSRGYKDWIIGQEAQFSRCDHGDRLETLSLVL